MGWDVSKSTKVFPQIILLTVVVFSLTFSVAFADHLTRGFVELRGDGTRNCLNTYDCIVPQSLAIHKGQIVTVDNNSQVVHTFTSGTQSIGSTGVFDSGLFVAGNSMNFLMDDVGRHGVFCNVHPWEEMEITVLGTNQPFGTVVGGSPSSSTVYLQDWESMHELTFTVEGGTRSSIPVVLLGSDSLVFEVDMTNIGFFIIIFPKDVLDSSTGDFDVFVGGEEYWNYADDLGTDWSISTTAPVGVNFIQIQGGWTNTSGPTLEYSGRSSSSPPSVDIDVVGSMMTITVNDPDRNLDYSDIDLAFITITDSTGYSIDYMIPETSRSSGIFSDTNSISGAPQGPMSVEYFYFDDFPPSLYSVSDSANVSYGVADPVSLTIDKSQYIAGSDLEVMLNDSGYNTNPTLTETVTVSYQSAIHPSISFDLIEINVNANPPYPPSTDSSYFTNKFTIPQDETGTFYIVLNHPNGRFVDTGSIGNLGVTIELDQFEYSWKDRIFITVLAPNFNVNSMGIDTIGDQSNNAVNIETLSGKVLPRYKLTETGTDTGIFTGEIILTGTGGGDVNGDGKPDGTGNTSGNGPTDGELYVDNRDEIKVEYFSMLGLFSVSADVRFNNGEIKFLAPSYKTSQNKAVLQLVDPDINLDPDSIDTITVETWSDSDPKGFKLTLRETGDATGIFTGDVIFSTINPSGGDKIYGKYIDRSPRGMTGPTHTETYIATASILGTRTVDTTPPTITVPPTIRKTTTGSDVTFAYLVSAVDDKDGPVSVRCFPKSLSTFKLGITTVRCSASDSSGNTATKTFEVIVTQTSTGADTTPPKITVPASDLRVKATSSLGAIVSYSSQVSANDNKDGPVKVTCLPGSGRFFDVGKTPVNCRATDSSRNTARASFNVLVETTTQTSIPSWLKQSLGLWCPEYKAGKSDIGTFLNLITWLVQKGLIVLPSTQAGALSTQAVPDWITNTACWWADGRLPDADLVNGFQWLIEKGIMRV